MRIIRHTRQGGAKAILFGHHQTSLPRVHWHITKNPERCSCTICFVLDEQPDGGAVEKGAQQSLHPDPRRLAEDTLQLLILPPTTQPRSLQFSWFVRMWKQRLRAGVLMALARFEEIMCQHGSRSSNILAELAGAPKFTCALRGSS